MSRARVLEVLGWWAAAYSVWLISLSTVPLQELLLGAACAFPCAVAAAGARWAIEEAWQVRARWLKPALVLPVAIVSDAVQVLLSSFVPAREGQFRRVQTSAAGAGAADRGRRALATGLISVTPGTYVLDIDPDSGEMVLHSLTSRGPRMERIVSDGVL